MNYKYDNQEHESGMLIKILIRQYRNKLHTNLPPPNESIFAINSHLMVVLLVLVVLLTACLAVLLSESVEYS